MIAGKAIAQDFAEEKCRRENDAIAPERTLELVPETAAEFFAR
jgi:hypothetical protein